MTSRADPAYAKPTPRPSGSECVGEHKCNYHATEGRDSWCSTRLFVPSDYHSSIKLPAGTFGDVEISFVPTSTPAGTISPGFVPIETRELVRLDGAALAFVAEVARDKCTIAPSSEAGASALGACSSSICYPCRARRVLS